MKKALFRLITLIVALLMVGAPASDLQAKTKSKAKTTATAKSSKSSKKSKASKTSKSSKSTKSSKKSGSSKTSRTKKSSASSTSRRRSASGSTRAAQSSQPSSVAATATPAASPRSSQFDSAADRAPAISSISAADSRRKIKVEKPDLEAIKQMTLDPSSKFYFPRLKQKYEKNDTTSMTPEDFRNFYLGYMFQEDFDPYRVSPYSKVTDELRQKPTHTKAEIDTIIKYSQLALEDNPFDLRQMSFLIHVLKESKKNMRAKIWEYRLENLLGAIKSTGTGDSVENAWYVMYPAHEYDMVQLLGYEAIDADFIEPGYDYLAVQPDESDKRRRDKSAKGFYFNVMMLQEQYELKHPEEIVTVENVVETPNPDELPASESTSDPIDPDDIPAE